MPMYAYACKDCSHAFDIQQSFSDDSLSVCPECSGSLRKKFNSVGVVFKGSGFYRTDSRESGSGGSSRKAKPDPAAAGSTSSASASTTGSSDGGSGSGTAASGAGASQSASSGAGVSTAASTAGAA